MTRYMWKSSSFIYGVFFFLFSAKLDLTKDNCQASRNCSPGFSSCQASKPCGTNWKCKNTIGSYKCECGRRMQGNGIDACGYVVPFLHVVNFSDHGEDVTSNDTHRPNKCIPYHQRLLNAFRTNNIAKIVIKTIEPLSPKNVLFNLTYDVYSKIEHLSPIDIITIFSERKARLSDSKGWYRGWEDPKPDNDSCTLSVIGFGDEQYQFQTTKRDSKSSSVEKCPGTDIPKATVSCKTRSYYDGSKSGYFDFRSITTYNCSDIPKPTTSEKIHVTTSVETENTLSTSVTTSELFTTEDDEQTTTSPTTFALVRETTAQEIDFEKTLIHFAESLSSENITSKNPQDIYSEATRVLTDFAGIVKSNDSMEISKIALNNSVQIVESLIQNHSALENVENNIALISAIETLSAKVKLEEGEIFILETKSISLEIVKISERNFSGIEFVVNDTWHNDERFSEMRSYIPAEAVLKASSRRSKRAKASFIIFKNASLFDGTLESKEYRIDQVLLASVSDAKITNLSQQFWFQMPIREVDTSKKNTILFRCAFLDKEKRTWLSEGCNFVAGSNPPNCTCNHMTNFAILVKNVKHPDEYALGILGKVGCSLSIIGLSLMLLCYLSIRSLRRIQTNQIHINLGVCLLIVYGTFLAGVEQVENKLGCMVVAAILQYFLLATWGWMMVECITMYKKFVLVLDYTGPKYVPKAAAIVYSITSAIVGATIAVTVGYYDKQKQHYEGWHSTTDDEKISFYISERMCWLRSYPLYFGFLVPVGLGLATNLVGFVRISAGITCYREKIKSSRTRSSMQEIKCYLERASIIAAFIGLSWIFAIPLTMTDDVITNRIFSWLFSMTNSLQGFVIFFFYCVRRSEVRKLLTRRLRSRITSWTNKETTVTEGNRDCRSIAQVAANDCNEEENAFELTKL